MAEKEKKTPTSEPKIKAPKPSDYRQLFIGTHSAAIKGKIAETFNWTYHITRDMTNSKFIVQKFKEKDGKWTESGDPIEHGNIACKLTRQQCRNFIRNIKK